MINPLEVLEKFLNAIDTDPRIRSTHIAAYMALYKCWLANNCPELLQIKGREVREMAKISSSATWHKTIRSLNEYGYILYLPTFNKMSATKVCLCVKH